MSRHSNRHHRATNAVKQPKFRERIILTNEQVDQLLVEAKQSRFGLDLHDAILLAISTGLRLGELAELTFDQVDTLKGEIGPSGRRSIQGVRTVLVTGVVLQMLTDRFAARGASPYVFGKAPHSIRHKLTSGLRTVREATGLPRICWHSFRHNFAIRLVNSGASVLQLCKFLGLTLPNRLKH